MNAAAPAAPRRSQHLRTLGLVAGSYAIDTALLAAFAALGSVGWAVPAAYAAVGALVTGAFGLVFQRGWNRRARDHYLALPQVLVHAAIPLLLVAWQPRLGVLALSVVFIAAAFGSLRLDRRGALAVGALLALAVGAAVLVAGERLDLPRARAAERVVTALWLGTVIARCMVVGSFGARLREAVLHGRQALADANRQLEDLASRDELTGARNRRAILQLAEQARAGHEAGGPPYAVALIDIDHFKRINDGHGHLVGDETLRRFVLLLAEQLRGADRLGRYGGEEFLALLPGVATPAAALRLAERLRERVQAEDWSGVAPGLAVRLSAGVAVARIGESVAQTLARADEALYAAKSGGRNRCIAAD